MITYQPAIAKNGAEYRIKCHQCNGTGTTDVHFGGGLADYTTDKCMSCGGTGTVVAEISSNAVVEITANLRNEKVAGIVSVSIARDTIQNLVKSGADSVAWTIRVTSTESISGLVVA